MARGRSYMNSYADGYMRGKVVKEVGALLDHILVEEIAPPPINKNGVWACLRYHQRAKAARNLNIF